MKKINWFKKHLLLKFIISVIIIALIILALLIFNDKANKSDINKTNIVLNDNLIFELDSDLYLLSIIKKISNGELITENKKIDTSKLGNQEVIINYINEKEQEQEYKFKIEIVDNVKPIIQFNKELTTTKDKKIDLLENVVVSDNSKEKIIANVNGDYDFNKVGTYNLKYIATDSSGNTVEENFVLTVKEEVNLYSQYSGSYFDTKSPTSNQVYNLILNSDKSYSIYINFGPDTIKLNGTYSINDKSITLNSSGTSNYKINKTVFSYNNGKLTYVSGGIPNDIRTNIGSCSESYECGGSNTLYKN